MNLKQPRFSVGDRVSVGPSRPIGLIKEVAYSGLMEDTWTYRVLVYPGAVSGDWYREDDLELAAPLPPEGSRSTPTCSTCRFASIADGSISCRRFPQIVRVSIDWWCGEWSSGDIPIGTYFRPNLHLPADGGPAYELENP